MNTKGWILLKILLNKYHQGSVQTMIAPLPGDQAQQVLEQDIQSHDFSIAFAKPEDLLSVIHYSWFAPAIKQFPESTQPILLDALEPSIQKPLKKHLKIESDETPLPLVVRRFFLQMLLPKIFDEEILPFSLLPMTPLSLLTNLKPSIFVKVIDYLSLYDLAEEMRHIIDKENLRKLYSMISPKKMQFLKACLNRREKISTPRLQLDHFSGNQRKLEHLLHRRGLVRLSKALSGTHPQVLWHIAHHLDTGRGNLLLKNVAEKEIPSVTPIITQQVLNVIKFLQPESVL